MLTETKEVVLLLAAVVKAGQGAAADGKIDLTDLGQLMLIFPALGPAIDKVDQVLPELEAMTEAGEDELIEFIDQQFGDGTYESVGEDLLQAAVHLMRVYTQLK